MPRSVPIDGSAPPGSPVGVVSRDPHSLDVFITDPNGGIYSVRWDERPETPTNLRVTNVADRRIDLSWVNNSNDAVGFRITYSGTSSAFGDHSGTQEQTGGASSASLTGLRSGYTYTISIVAFNAGGDSSHSNEVQATTPERHIGVSSQGVGAATVFTVTGNGFTANSLVVIRVTADNFGQVQFQQTAGAEATFTSRHSVQCVSGQKLTFTAFEDADPIGTMAVPVELDCP